MNMDNKMLLPYKRKGYTQYGAFMGRGSDCKPEDLLGKVHLRRSYLDNGGYDKGGAYWGLGDPLFCAWNDEGNEVYFRASTREAAKKMLPNCTFYR